MENIEFTLENVLGLVRQSYANAQGTVSFQDLFRRAWMELEAFQLPFIKRVDRHLGYHSHIFHYEQAPHALGQRVSEAYFYLIREGFVVETWAGDVNQPPYPTSYSWTERGTRWLGARDPMPESSQTYLAYLRLRAPALDPVINQYVVEALEAFGRQAYFAAAVMVGAASEKALYMLSDALLVALKEEQRPKLKALQRSRSLRELFHYIRSRIEQADKLRDEVGDGVAMNLLAIFEAIRVQRNNAVHPKTATVSEQSVRTLLVALPNTLSVAEETRLWLLSNAESL